MLFACIGPKLTTAFRIAAKTLDGTSGLFLFSVESWIVVECQLFSCWDITQSEEGEVIDVIIGVINGDWFDLAVWITGVVHEAGDVAEFAAIDDIVILLSCRVLFRDEVEAEEIRNLLIIFAIVCFFLC